MGRLYEFLATRLLRRARRIFQDQALPPGLQRPLDADACKVIVFFNLESAFAMGHSILGLEAPGQPLLTFSFFRKSRRVVAPAKVATIREEITFQQVVERSGWILHGTDDDQWNEHMTCCLALSCSPQAYERVLRAARAVQEHPGTYLLLSRNCIHVCRRQLAAGGIRMLKGNGRPFRTILPRRVACDAAGAEGAEPLGAWRYWFAPSPAPRNGYRVRPLRVQGKLEEPGA